MTAQVRAFLRVVGYVRVSTERHAEEGLGLEVQERAIRAWAKVEGHRIVRIHRDEGLSGSNGLDTRDGLAEALEDLRQGAARGLVVYRLHRLARDLVLQEQLLAEVRRLHSDLFSTSAAEGAFLLDDPDDPSRKLIRQVLGAVSEYERPMIGLRLRSGRRRKAERGGYAFGAPPFGYAAHDGQLVKDPDEQEALACIRTLRNGGASLRSIAAVLEAAGVHPRRGARWHPAVLARILDREDGPATA